MRRCWFCEGESNTRFRYGKEERYVHICWSCLPKAARGDLEIEKEETIAVSPTLQDRTNLIAYEQFGLTNNPKGRKARPAITFTPGEYEGKEVYFYHCDICESPIFLIYPQSGDYNILFERKEAGKGGVEEQKVYSVQRTVIENLAKCDNCGKFVDVGQLGREAEKFLEKKEGVEA